MYCLRVRLKGAFPSHPAVPFHGVQSGYHINRHGDAKNRGSNLFVPAVPGGVRVVGGELYTLLSLTAGTVREGPPP